MTLFSFFSFGFQLGLAIFVLSTSRDPSPAQPQGYRYQESLDLLLLIRVLPGMFFESGLLGRMWLLILSCNFKQSTNVVLERKGFSGSRALSSPFLG